MSRAFVLILVLLVAASVHSLAQQFENEGLTSDTSHRNSAWYLEFSSPQRDMMKVIDLLHADTSVAHGKRSLEWREVIRWISTTWDHVRANGLVAEPLIDAAHIQRISARNASDKGAEDSHAEFAWTNIGPFTWDRGAKAATGSMGIGVVRCVDVSAIAPNVIIVGTVSAGIWRSTNQGKTWANVSTDIVSRFVNNVKIAPSNVSLVYAATDVGVARSTDGGETFRMSSYDRSGEYPRQDLSADVIAVDPNDPYTIVVGGRGVFKRSTDGGITWVNTSMAMQSAWDVQWHPKNSDVVYALTNEGQWSTFLRSTNGGRTFAPVVSGLPVRRAGHYILRGRIATSAAEPDNVWVIYGGGDDTVSGVYGLYRSENSGVDFSHVCCGEVEGPEPSDKNKNPNLFHYDVGASGTGQLTWDMAFDVSDDDASVMVTAGIFPYESTDGGATWSPYSAVHYDVQDAVLSNGKAWIATDGGIYHQDSGRTLVDRSDGICAVEVWGFGQSHINNTMALGAYHLPVILRDDAVYQANGYIGGWYGWSGADAMNADVHPDDERWIYAKPWTSVRGQRGTDRAVAPLSEDLGIDLGYIPRTNVAFHPRKSYTLFAVDHATSSVVRSDNNASTWYTLFTPPERPYRVRVSEADPNVIIVTTFKSLYRTTNGGAEWHAIYAFPTSDPSGRVSDVVLDDDDASHMWVSLVTNDVSARLFETTDGGETWMNITDGLPTYDVLCLAHQRSANDVIYAGTTAGVQAWSRSSGWTDHGVGLPLTRVHFLHVDDDDGVLRAGTDRGIWQVPLAASSAPKASITMDRDTVICARSPIRFASRSVLRRSVSSQIEWMFEGGEPTRSSLPIVNVFYNVPGTYDVRLIARNDFGSDTMLLEDAVTVLPSECEGIDVVAGKAVALNGANDYVSLPAPSQPLTAFTFMSWIRRHDDQPAFSCVMSSNSTDEAAGFVALHFFDDTQELGYHWTGGRWWWRSGLVVPKDEWVHVALMVDADGATVCMNGIAAHDSVLLGSIDLSTSTFILGSYKLWIERNADIDMDEVRMFNRALTVDEVRRQVHHPADLADASLLSVYQFNESRDEVLYDKVHPVSGTLERGAKHVASTIPFGPGRSVTLPSARPEWTSYDGSFVDVDHDAEVGSASMISFIHASPTADQKGGFPLGQRWWVMHVFDTTLSTIGNIRIHTDEMMPQDIGQQRRYTFWSRNVSASSDDAWTNERQLIDVEPSYDPMSETLRIWMQPSTTMPMQFYIGVSGEPVSVQNENAVIFSVWPVPAGDLLHVKGEFSVGDRLRLMDMQGRIVSENAVENTMGVMVLSVQQLPAGLYTLIVNDQRRPVPIIH